MSPSNLPSSLHSSLRLYKLADARPSRSFDVRTTKSSQLTLVLPSKLTSLLPPSQETSSSHLGRTSLDGLTFTMGFLLCPRSSPSPFIISVSQAFFGMGTRAQTPARSKEWEETVQKSAPSFLSFVQPPAPAPARFFAQVFPLLSLVMKVLVLGATGYLVRSGSPSLTRLPFFDEG